MEELEIILECEANGEQEIELISEGTVIYPHLEDLTITPRAEQQTFNHPNSYGYDNVTVEPVNLQNKQLTLSENGIYNIKADEEYLGLNNVEVTIDAIEDLEAELNTYEEEVTDQKTKLEAIVETLKTKGVVEAKELNVTPTKEQQNFSGLYNQVNVEGVTSAIDENIVADNIKEGIEILGVKGAFVGGKYTPCYVSFKGYKGTDLNYEVTNLDTSNLTTMSTMFENTTSLTSLDLSDFNTKNVTNMNGMFYNNLTLKSLNLSSFNTSSVTDMSYMFYLCKALTNLDLSNFDLTSVNNVGYMFTSCTGMTDLIFGNNLGKAFKQKTNNYSSYKLDLSKSTKLTHDSLMDVINKLYDLNLSYDVANGGTLYTQQLILGSTNKAKLTADEIAIATNKGWVVS